MWGGGGGYRDGEQIDHQGSLPCGAGSTVPGEGFDSSVIMPFSWFVVAVTLPI